MRKILIAVLLLSVAAPAMAQKLETVDEYNRRIQSERYQSDKARGGQQPMGGYKEPLGGGSGARGTYSGSTGNGSLNGNKKCTGINCPLY